MVNDLVGIGYKSDKADGEDGFLWLTIYRGATEDFENLMQFINEYLEEKNIT